MLDELRFTKLKSYRNPNPSFDVATLSLSFIRIHTIYIYIPINIPTNCLFISRYRISIKFLHIPTTYPQLQYITIHPE